MIANLMIFFCAIFQWQANLVLLDGGVLFSVLFDSVYMSVKGSGTTENKLLEFTIQTKIVSGKW